MSLSDVARRRICNIIFFLLSSGLGWLFLFKIDEKELQNRVALQFYGIVSIFGSLALLTWYEQITGWFIFHHRYEWLGKTVVGVGMLIFASFVAIVRENTESALVLQASIVTSLYSLLQMIVPSNDFGMVDFGLRIPVLTSFKVYGVSIKCVLIFLCASIMILFYEYYTFHREKRERDEREEVAAHALQKEKIIIFRARPDFEGIWVMQLHQVPEYQ